MSTVATNCFVWMSPSVQPDYNQDPAPYVMQVLVTGFAVDADGKSLDVPSELFDAYYQVQAYLMCGADETPESLRSKAANFVRDAYGQPDMPITFLFDAEQNA